MGILGNFLAKKTTKKEKQRLGSAFLEIKVFIF